MQGVKRRAGEGERERQDARQCTGRTTLQRGKIDECLSLGLAGGLAGSLVGGNLGLLLGDALGKELLVLLLLDVLSLSLADLERALVTLALETRGGHETLDLGGLGVRLGTLLLRDDLAANDKLADVVLLGEVEELADVVGTLGTKALGDGGVGVGEAGDLVVALLDNNEVEGLDIGADDAATDRLALALTGAAGAVARVTLGEEETHTVGEEDTLLHGETLLVVTTADAEDVALPLVAERVDLDVLRHALLVEAANEALILDVERLLGTRGRVSNVELHL
ncbi:hypothetical protein L1887_56641 [Cichorium endivia]|nr:hypothetical protein L1887_56641 [Cichorium endivia]